MGQIWRIEAVIPLLATSEELGIGGNLVLGINLALVAGGTFFLFRQRKGGTARSPFMVQLWKTNAIEAGFLTMCLLVGFFGPLNLGFLPILVAFVSIWFFRRDRHSNLLEVSNMNWRALTLDASARLLKIWPALFIVSFVASQFLADHPKQESIRKLAEYQSLKEVLGIAGYAVIVAPLLEEFLFRGILYRTMKRPFGMGFAIGFTSLLFALVHKNLLSFFPLVLLGGFLAIAYERTGDLRTCILMHALFNFIMVLFVLLRHAL